jgi:hypothetical protein
MIYVDPQLPKHFLLSVGGLILPAAAGWSIIQALGNKDSLRQSITLFFVGALALTFYDAGFELLKQLGDILEKDIQKLGNPNILKNLVWKSISTAAGEPDAAGDIPSIANLPAIGEQVFRTGVWGIASTMGDFFFLLSELFIEVRRDVLLTLIHIFFPIFCGFLPLFPSLLKSATLQVVEMALWGPCLLMIQLITSDLAPIFLQRSGSLGMPIIALEIVSVLLVLSIPTTVNKLLQGALVVGGEATLLKMPGAASKFMKKSIPLVLLSLFTSSLVQAGNREIITVYNGYKTQIHCRGTLYISAIGNDNLVKKEAFPEKMRECGIILSPLQASGRTDLLLKTSAGDFHPILEIRNAQQPKASDLEVYLSHDEN